LNGEIEVPEPESRPVAAGETIHEA
jgi:hypothetical protein